MTRRFAWILTAGACAGMLGFALYSQYVLELYPCPLCIFQRVAVFALLVVAVVAALHNPRNTGARVYGVLGVLAAGIGIGIAARHVWLQNLPADQVPTCGAGLEFMLETLPLFSVIEQVLTASGECAEISWELLGLSMPAWVVVALSATVLWILYTSFLLPQRKSSARAPEAY